MSDQTILDQIHIQRQAGVGDEQIKKILRIEGFSEPEIEQALKDAALAAPPAMPNVPTRPPETISAMPQQPPANLPTAAAVPVPVSVPQVEASAPVAAMPAPHHSIVRVGLTILGIIFLLAAAAGVAFAYMQKIGPFAHAPYSEADLLSGILAASGHITSDSYSISGALSVAPRDADAYPFSIQVSNRDEMIAKYGDDYKRVQSATSLLSTLQTYAHKTYPATLDAVAAATRSYLGAPSINDPSTDMPYSYVRSSDGKDFTLTMTFETPEAITAIQNSGKYASSTTIVNGMTVTFNKGSSSFFYVSADPPEPYLEQMADWMRFLSPDVSADLTASASADWANADGEWKFNIDANGDLGDLSYKIDVDALKKNGSYFVRVNNIPSIFAGPFSSVKGTWIKIDPSTISTSSPSDIYGSIAAQIPEQETKYKENRAAFTAFIQKVTQIAEQQDLVTLKNPPQSERVDGTLLYRYDLDIKKDAILPFYQQMMAEAAKNTATSDYDLFNDPGTVAYLQSDEFSQVFDYFEQNVKISLWVDPAGYPEKVTYTMRIVPPDTATQLKDKQVMLTFTATLSNINQPVIIDEPTDSKPIQDIISELETNSNYSLDNAKTDGRDARRVADIKHLQLALELYYDANGVYPATISNAALVTPGYIAAIPKDPSTNASYVYAGLGATSCTHYHLGAVLEDANTALSTDTDASPKSVCKGSARDFSGTSASCDTAAGSTERCFDVSN